ncbi:MAG TPA: hypothetical protein VK589_31200 [Chryseolinea sp.]|nr:hypothetical protein [Chryseolinea sp.]
METKSNEWEATTRKNVRHLAYWTGAWVLTVALASFGPKFLWDYNSSTSIVAILVSTLVGVGMILMNRKYTNGLDELHRKVTMEAMAIALGVGVVGGLSYSLLDVSNVIPFDAEVGPLIGLIGITYFIAFIVGSIRYK